MLAIFGWRCQSKIACGSDPYRTISQNNLAKGPGGMPVNWYLGLGGIACLVVGLVGQGFELRRLRRAEYGDEIGSPNLFTDRRNIKWYALIGAGIAMWYAAERT